MSITTVKISTPSQPVRVGVVGAGKMGSNHLRIYGGLKGVELVVSDAHEGVEAAVARVLGATWRRCRVHFMRNALF